MNKVFKKIASKFIYTANYNYYTIFKILFGNSVYEEVVRLIKISAVPKIF